MVKVIVIDNCKINRSNKLAKIKLEGKEERDRINECYRVLEQKEIRNMQKGNYDRQDIEKMKRHKESIEFITKEKPEKDKKKKNDNKNNNNNNIKDKKEKPSRIITLDLQKCHDMKLAINEKINDFHSKVIRPKGGLNQLSKEEREEYDKLWILLKQFNQLKNELSPRNKNEKKV